MYDLTPIFEQARAFMTQHLPPEMMARTVLIPLALLVAGIGLSVFGAKLARPAMTTVFALLGGYVGVLFAREAGYPAPIGGLVGGGMFATIAFLTFRLWVGVVAAIVVAAIALGTFGYQELAPHLSEFDSSMTWAPTAQSLETADFAVPSPTQQQSYLDRDPAEWAEKFWAFVGSRDASVPEDGKLLGLAAFVGGLFLGVVAMRWMLILSTSVVGTALVVTSTGALLARFFESPYQTVQDRPGVIGIAVGAILVTSMIIQTLLTRRGRRLPAEAV